MFSDTIYLKDNFGDNKTIYNVDYLGYRDKSIYFFKEGETISFKLNDIKLITDTNKNRINPFKFKFEDGVNGKDKPYKKSKSIQSAKKLLISGSILNLALVNTISRGNLERDEIDALTLIAMALYVGGFIELANAIDK